MEVKIGMLGFGNVGTGVYKILQENGTGIERCEGLNIKIAKVLVRDVNKKRNINVDTVQLTDKFEDILNDPEIKIIAEFMGGANPAREYILAAFKKGKTVVTANKEVIAKHWQELGKAARDNNVGLYFEASVAGGIPVIKVMNESLQANKICQMMGIINGTTNYILTKMSEEGRDFNEILSEAQKLGYAEPDPTADVEGYDTSYKLSILSSIAFNTWVGMDKIYREGISKITIDDIKYGKELGLTLKLLAIAKKQNNCIETRVHPTFIPMNHPLASVRDAYNGIFIKGDMVGNLMLYGRGAGDLPTGSAVVSDIVSACKMEGRYNYRAFYDEGYEAGVGFNNNWETEFFIRMTANDKPGVLAKIAGAFGKYDVSLTSVIQKEHNVEIVPLIFVTHKANEQSMMSAIKEIMNIDAIMSIDNVIRVER